MICILKKGVERVKFAPAARSGRSSKTSSYCAAAFSRWRTLSAGGQLEQPCEVNNSNKTTGAAVSLLASSVLFAGVAGVDTGNRSIQASKREPNNPNLYKRYRCIALI